MVVMYEQGVVQVFFEVVDMQVDCGLCQVQCVGCSGEGVEVDDGDQGV